MSRKAYHDVLVSPIEKADGQLHVFIVNDRLKQIKGKLLLRVIDMDGHEVNKQEKNIDVAANVSQDVLQISVERLLMGKDRKDVVVLASFSCDKVYENAYYLCKPKEMHFNKPAISVRVVKNDDGYDVILTADKVARGVFLSLNGIDNVYSENYLDLMPGREKTVQEWTSLSETELKKQLEITSLSDVQ